MSAIRNYAKALFIEAKQGHREQQVMEQLTQVVSAITKVEGYREFFASPMIPQDQMQAVLVPIKEGKAYPELYEVLHLMVQNGRMSEVAELAAEYQSFLDETTGVLRGVVTTASALNDKSRAEVVEKMSQLLKKKIIFDYIQDEKILGGTRVEVAGMTFEDSLSSHLNRMSENLNRSRI
jgi:F-type H+-transporting ATPase subunit delta